MTLTSRSAVHVQAVVDEQFGDTLVSVVAGLVKGSPTAEVGDLERMTLRSRSVSYAAEVGASGVGGVKLESGPHKGVNPMTVKHFSREWGDDGGNELLRTSDDFRG